MDSEGLITKVRKLIADNTTLKITDIFSPELPLDDKENICCVTPLPGIPRFDLTGQSTYTQPIRTLVRGTQNDTTTRAIADEIYNALNLTQGVVFNSSRIVVILATTTPIYVGKDENQRVLYNITFNLIVEGE
jgi:hypothetical protein